MIARKGLGSIRFYDGERALQSQIAGLIWSQSYSIGDAFYKARGALAADASAGPRSNAISPIPMTAPRRMRSRWRWRGSSAANCCRRPRPGDCCRPWARPRPARRGSARRSARAGNGRTRPAPGQNFQGRVGGINDIGILTAPDGAAYAMAIMTVPNKTDGASQNLMQSVTRAVIAAHDARYGG